MITLQVHEDIADELREFNGSYTAAREQPGSFATLLLRAEFKGSEPFITASEERTRKLPARKRA